MSCARRCDRLQDPCAPKFDRNRYCGGMTNLRVHAPSETDHQLTQLRKLADAGVATDQNEPFGDQTWVELNAGNAWLVTTGDEELTGASAIVIAQDPTQP